eukprot:3106769-Prymnesium_polylepis.1
MDPSSGTMDPSPHTCALTTKFALEVRGPQTRSAVLQESALTRRARCRRADSAIGAHAFTHPLGAVAATPH